MKHSCVFSVVSQLYSKFGALPAAILIDMQVRNSKPSNIFENKRDINEVINVLEGIY